MTEQAIFTSRMDYGRDAYYQRKINALEENLERLENRVFLMEELLYKLRREKHAKG